MHAARLRDSAWIGPVALVLWVGALYGASLRNDFVYDDRVLISEAPAPDGAGDILRVFGERHWANLPYYRPVSRVTMVVQKGLHGNRPAPYHALNLALLAVAALLVLALLRWPALAVARGPALGAAALFAAHPVASSCVYPIASGRETLIPAVWVLAALCAFLRRGVVAYTLALCFFALALLSKEQAVVVPGLFALADALRLTAAPPATAREWGARYAPVAAIALAYFALRTVIFQDGGDLQLALSKHPEGLPLSLLYAAQTWIAPFASLHYEPRAVVWLSAWRLGLAAMVVAAGVIALRRHRPSLRAPVLFWGGWMLLTLLPTANLLVQEARFAERYTLLAGVGALAIAATWASAIWEHAVARRALSLATLALLLFWGGISAGRAQSFRDDLAFHAQWLASDPLALQPHVSLGETYAAHGQLDASLHHYRQALALQPDHAPAHFGLGAALARQGDIDAAEAAYRRALEADPNHPQAHNNLAALLERRGDFAQAFRHYEQALSLDPEPSRAHRNLAILASRAEDWPRAVAHYRKSLDLDPDSVPTANSLAWILATSADLELRDGGEAHRWALRAAEATGYRNPGVLSTLAAACAENGDFDEAVRWQEAALEQAPRSRRPELSRRLALYESRHVYRSE
jgi:tetratricopeptide (TPR) repeat protein